MVSLILPLKRIYFEQIRDGVKLEEFRLCTPYWQKRLEGRSYDKVILTLGYPAKDDSERRLARSWGGCTTRWIKHPHFGDELVKVFSIDVSKGCN
jgi:hypothetical protein